MHALDQLAADLSGYVIDIVVISETHFKPSKHSDSMMNIAGYTLFRRDRPRRRGGGVAIYIGANPHTVAREVQPVKLRPCV